ncbi:hypothetical protein MLP_28870 [Microlunatus phosphovorus NM-1]|uniref:VOC domain-containing protein n=1 Tax=Microlunatus phosphovorus (strain ATCC 700054 / DSM 10555 / JCM 9379 / NBRC 101784 / NCIMB 13414 / VKM Ac-1990 / NM-1) TaxID=1032480 RepID=F5XJK1_MICPN|nr:VOC family protein [Microlunatus phosphovorus]BAK35901.1 hypothetical protein MLP_28870 [Microlunatus phosphovorus NM-1]
MQPALTGQIVVILTVNDADRSAAWYGRLLGAAESSRYSSGDGPLQVVVEEPATGMQLCLLSRPGNRSDRFDERRIGLDHVEFLVATRAALDDWAEHLDQLGVVHSGIKEPRYGSAAMVTLRDPDNIQLEFYWPGS